MCFQPDPRKVNSRQGYKTCSFKSNPIREKYPNDIKPFKEFRTGYENTFSFPHSVHGIVKADCGDGIYHTGTGILIGPALALTAAHNIYDYEGSKEKYSKIVFIPGINEQLIPFGLFKVVESYVPDEYLNT